MPCDLHHPALIRMRHHTGHVDLATREMDEKQHVVRHQPCGCPDLGGEEIRRDEDLHVRANELLPGGRLLLFRRRWEATAFQDIADRLITDRVTQMCEGTDDAVIAPGA